MEREENYEPRLLDPPLSQEAATVGYVAAGTPLSSRCRRIVALTA